MRGLACDMAHPSFDIIRTIIDSSGLAAPTGPEPGQTPEDQALGWRDALEQFATEAAPPEGITLTPLRIGSMAVDLLAPTPTQSGSHNQQHLDDEFPTIDLSGPLLVYLHGGGYSAGSRATHRDIAGRLAQTANITTAVLEYPLAPESPFPAAIEAVAECIDDLSSHGVHANQIILAGDSAGGGLCVGTLMKLRDQGRTLPLGAVLLSPWVDLTVSDTRSVDLDGHDPLIGVYALQTLASVYASPEERSLPLASPVFGNLAGLPPIQIHVGDREVLYPDALRLHDAIIDHGGSSDLHVYKELTHVFQLMPPEIVPETGESFERARDFINTLLTESETP